MYTHIGPFFIGLFIGYLFTSDVRCIEISRVSSSKILVQINDFEFHISSVLKSSDGLYQVYQSLDFFLVHFHG